MNLKCLMKKSKFVVNSYYKLFPIYCKINPRRAVEIQFKQTFGYYPDLDNPKTFNEKLCWLKLYEYRDNPLVEQCSDKYRVYEYIESLGYGKLLKKLYGVYERAEDIDFDALPDRFALKFNKASGFNLICDDKSKLDRAAAVQTMKKWFHVKTGEQFCEMQYEKSKPLIICEEYIGRDDGSLPVDYKFNCFNGEPKVTRICYGKNAADDHYAELVYKVVIVDDDYNKLDYSSGYMSGDEVPPKPDCYGEMIEIARKLSKPFPFVRVDMFYVGGKIYFGELSFTSCGGYTQWFNDKAQRILGDYLTLPKK